MNIQWKKEKFYIREEFNFDEIAKKCNTSSDNIRRVVSVYYDDMVCLYLLTCSYNNIRSFHGYNFVKHAQWLLLPFARKYIEEEKLEWSSYNTEATKAILKRLGFKHETTVMRRI